jgi:hypothetical protein
LLLPSSGSMQSSRVEVSEDFLLPSTGYMQYNLLGLQTATWSPQNVSFYLIFISIIRQTLPHRSCILVLFDIATCFDCSLEPSSGRKLVHKKSRKGRGPSLQKYAKNYWKTITEIFIPKNGIISDPGIKSCLSW